MSSVEALGERRHTASTNTRGADRGCRAHGDETGGERASDSRDHRVKDGDARYNLAETRSPWNGW